MGHSEHWNEPDAEHPEEFGTVQPEGLQDDGTPNPAAVGQLVPSPVERARVAAQDHGAERFIHNNADAGVLGDCGLAAVRVVLEHLIDKAKTDGDPGAVEAMYALAVELGEDGDY